MSVFLKVAVLFCLVTLWGGASAALYKWVDEEGVTHFTTTAPPTLAGQIVTPTGSYNEADDIFNDDMPGVKCYLGDITKDKKPKTGDMNDLVIMSVIIGTPKSMFDSNPVLRSEFSSCFPCHRCIFQCVHRR